MYTSLSLYIWLCPFNCRTVRNTRKICKVGGTMEPLWWTLGKLSIRRDYFGVLSSLLESMRCTKEKIRSPTNLVHVLVQAGLKLIGNLHTDCKNNQHPQSWHNQDMCAQWQARAVFFQLRTRPTRAWEAKSSPSKPQGRGFSAFCFRP